MCSIRRSLRVGLIGLLVIISPVCLSLSRAHATSTFLQPENSSVATTPRLTRRIITDLAQTRESASTRTISATRNALATPIRADALGMNRMLEPRAIHSMRSRAGRAGKHFAYVKMLEDSKRISFIENRGQANRSVRLYARNGSKTLWLTRKGMVFEVLHKSARRADKSSVARPQPATALGTRPAARAHLQRTVFSERLTDANPGLKVVPGDARPGVFNYFVGHNNDDWHAGAKSYALVTYRDAWKGVNMRLYGLKGNLEQEFVVMPDADPGRIGLALSGVKGLSIAKDGSLLIHTPLGVLRQEKPFAYQTVDGKRRQVAASFRIEGHDRVSFNVASYDRHRPLVIDPAIIYSTYLGGVHDDEAWSIAVDAEGNAYVAGFAASENFPVSANAYQLKRQNIGVYVYNAFVTKFSPSGTIIYSTFLGGSGDMGTGSCPNGHFGDCANAIAIDANGDAYVAGSSGSSDFPITSNAFQKTFGSGSADAFVSELSPDGSTLLYSTYLGSSGSANATTIAQGPGGVYIGGSLNGSSSFPTTKGAFERTPKGSGDGFVAKINTALSGDSSLVYSTILGGSTSIPGGVYALTVDSSGDAFVTGQTHSSDFPTTTGVYQPAETLQDFCNSSGNPNSSAFVTEVAPNGKSLIFSTFLGGETVDGTGCDQFGHAIVLDSSGNIWLFGSTSTKDFPTTSNAYQGGYPGGEYTGFIAELNSDGTKLEYGSYLGGTAPTSPSNAMTFPGFNSMFADSTGDVMVAGWTNATNFPTMGDALFGSYQGGAFDGFLTQLKVGSTSTSLAYSTYIGGSGSDSLVAMALDPDGNIHLAGFTDSTNFPVSTNAFQTQIAEGMPNDGDDAFVMSLGSGIIGSVAPSSGGNFGSTTISVTGAGFESGATAELLSGGSPVATGKFVKVLNGGATLRATFDLTSVSPGTYDVEVINPDNTSFLAQGAFTVQAGGGAKLWVNLVGRSKIRVGTPSTFYIDYGNSGLNDAYMARIWLEFPTASLNYKLGMALTQPQIPGDSIDVSGAPVDVTQGDQTIVPLIIPVVRAGASGAVPIVFTAPSVESGITIKSWVNPAGTSSISQVTSSAPPPSNTGAGSVGDWTLPQCYSDMTQYAIESFGFATPQQCWGAFPKNLQDTAAGSVATIMNGSNSLNSYLMSLTQFLDQQDQAIDQCLQSNNDSSPGLNKELDSTVQSIVQLVENTITNYDCKVEVEVEVEEDDNTEDENTDDNTDSGNSIDPNAKAGPAGVTKGHWVLNNQPLTYTVSFENEPTATLPAQQVVVTDQLHPRKVKLDTVQLGPISFGSTVVRPPAGVNSYSTTVNVSQNLSVQIQGSLDSATGVLKWTFRSIDPSTGLPPADPSVGFLPPDTSPPNGDGSVVFSVMPKKRLPNGAKLKNRAVVVFDSNAPIDTNRWHNKIAKPVGQSLLITPGRLVFRNVPIFGFSGALSYGQRVTLTNPGPSPMVVTAITPTANFLVHGEKCCETALEPGQSCGFGVHFQPVDIGKVHGHITISDNDPKFEQKLRLVGIGVAGHLRFYPNPMHLGKVPVNTTGTPKVLALINKTKATASIVSLVPSSAEFVISNDQCTGTTLAPGARCKVDLAFDPTGTGKVKGKLTVTTDSAKVQHLTLYGTGTP